MILRCEECGALVAVTSDDAAGLHVESEVALGRLVLRCRRCAQDAEVEELHTEQIRAGLRCGYSTGRAAERER